MSNAPTGAANVLQPQAEGIPVLKVTPITRPFWEGCNAGRLLYQRCNRCDAAIFNPAHRCRQCTSDDLRWEESAGFGTIYSWTVCHRPMSPAFTVPYAPVIVDLDEGYQILSNVIGIPPEEVRVGLRVRVEFHAIGDRSLPYFRPLPDLVEEAG
jgi:uncharacterized OB-fold protein